MADAKISALTDLSTDVSTADTIVVVDATDTTTKKTTIANTLALLPSVGSDGAYVATDESTASASYTNLATGGPAVTATTGTMALVTIYCGIYMVGVGQAFMGFAVSGATTVAADPTMSIISSFTGAFYVGSSFVVTGLTAGSNVFTAKYKMVSGTAAHFLYRRIGVVPLN